MKITPAPLKDCFILEPLVFKDERGYFFESFHAEKFKQFTGIHTPFVQDNQSFSNYGTIRGLHYQSEPNAQAKLIRVLTGKILDVVVDIRPDSTTFGKVFSIELSADNFLQLYIPRGFAHGFSVLSPSAVVHYKCDVYYHREAEAGIRFNDPQLAIDWKIDPTRRLISDKDQKQPFFKDLFG